MGAWKDGCVISSNCRRNGPRFDLSRTAIILAFICISIPAAAQDAKPPVQPDAVPEPIRITAERLVTDSKESSAEFSGHVRAIQGNTVITAQRLKIYYQSGGDADQPVAGSESLKKIIASGDVEIKFDNRVAVTQEAVYITDDKRLVLTGPNSKITSGKDSVSGSKITFFRSNGRIQVESEQGNRVEAVIYPGEKGLN
jgi:lipopolysaccharide export system protein LptA